MTYNLELEEAIEAIKEKNADKVLIQLPEGLKTKSKKIMEKIKEETEAEPVLDGEPVYGACCIPGEKEREEYDLVIHFAHTEMVPAENVIYIPVKSTKDVYDVTKKAAEKTEGEKIGLTTTSQHLHKLKEMKKAVKETGKTPVTSEKKERLKEGQVLGCRFTAATDIEKNVDSLIFIGSGKFHPQGIASTVDKKVIQGNPYTDKAIEIEPGQWEKEKEMRKDKARNAEVFAVVETSHPGQRNIKITKEIKKKLNNKGKDIYTVKSRNVTPKKLDYLPFDAFIINACPRIVLDDWSNYKKPVLLPKEAEELIKS